MRAARQRIEAPRDLLRRPAARTEDGAGGFEIPLPQRELRLRGLFGEQGEDALAALKLESRKTKAAAKRSKAATNDAAVDLLADAAAEAEDEAQQALEKRP